MNKQIQAKENSRKTYAPPRLTTHGAVRLLTQAGTMGGSEGNMDTATSRKTMSDRIAKENVMQVGVHPLGIALYLFDYKPEFQEKCGYGKQFGVMADEVETVMPEAVVVHPDGYKMVDYAMLGISHPHH